MYSLETAYVRERQENADWQIVNLSGVSIANAMNQYKDIYLVLTNPFLVGTHIFNLYKDLDAVDLRSHTFNQWLGLLGNQSLPTVKGHIAFTKASVKYKDAFHAKFHARCVNPLTHPDVPAPRDLLKNVLIHRPDTNYFNVADYALFTVGGFLHRSYPTAQGISLVGAGESLAISNNNNLGVISFQDVGKIKMVQITESMISRVIDTQPLYHTLAIDIGEDVSDKQLGIVIGGALHILNGVIHKNSPTGALVYTSKINMRELYAYLLNKINVGTLAETFGVIENGVLREEQFQTDGFILALMTLPQSFLVIVESDLLHKEVRGLESCSIPFTGYAYGDLDGIVMNTRNFCAAVKITKFKDINKISGEIRMDGSPARREAYGQLESGVNESLTPGRSLSNELDHVLWLGTNTLSIIED